MTEAQITLYAELRVAVPVEWRISMADHEGWQHVFLTRPVYAEPGPLAPGFARFFRLPNHQVVGIEKLAISRPLWEVESSAQARRFMTYDALEQIGAIDSEDHRG